MLGEEVRGIVRSRDFVEREVSSFEPILHPKIAHMQMSHFAQTTAATNADRRSGVGMEVHIQGDSQVFG